MSQPGWIEAAHSPPAAGWTAVAVANGPGRGHLAGRGFWTCHQAAVHRLPYATGLPPNRIDVDGDGFSRPKLKVAFAQTWLWRWRLGLWAPARLAAQRRLLWLPGRDWAAFESGPPVDAPPQLPGSRREGSPSAPRWRWRRPRSSGLA